MGLPVTVYRNTDVGAPVGMPTKPSDWLTILKACLVDGFGTKASAGWTLDFGSLAELKMVFRNSVADGGTGGAVQVEAHAGTDTVGQLVRFTCANAITALDTFARKCGYRVIPTTNNTSYVGGWMIVATSRGFWVIQEAGTTGINNSASLSTSAPYSEYYFVGDIESSIPNDVGGFTIFAGGTPSSDSASTVYTENLGNYAGPGCQLYASDGDIISANYTADIGRNSTLASSGAEIDPQLSGTPITLTKSSVMRDAPTSAVLPSCRGSIPGLFSTYFFGYKGQAVPIIRTFDGTEFRLINCYYIASNFIQISGEWYV